MYVSNNRNFEPTMELQLLFNEDVHHYVSVYDLLELVCTVKEKQFTNNLHRSRNCFAFSHCEEQHQVHDDECRNGAPAAIKMPGDNFSFRFKNFKAQWFAPINIYLNFESFLMPFSTFPANPDASSTEIVEQHILSGFPLTLIENGFSTKGSLSTAPKFAWQILLKTTWDGARSILCKETTSSIVGTTSTKSK